MAFTGNYSCNTLRSGLANGTINFATDTFYLALYTNSATLDQTTTAYTTIGEASGGNYVAGGQIVTATIASEGHQTTPLFCGSGGVRNCPLRYASLRSRPSPRRLASMRASLYFPSYRDIMSASPFMNVYASTREP